MSWDTSVATPSEQDLLNAQALIEVYTRAAQRLAAPLEALQEELMRRIDTEVPLEEFTRLLLVALSQAYRERAGAHAPIPDEASLRGPSRVTVEFVVAQAKWAVVAGMLSVLALAHHQDLSLLVARLERVGLTLGDFKLDVELTRAADKAAAELHGNARP